MEKKYFELDVFPELKTNRLLLDTVRLTDSMSLYEIFKDKNVAAQMNIMHMRSLEEAVSLIKLWRSFFRSRNRLRWAIRPQINREFIGSIGFKYIYSNAEAEIGFELHPKYHRKGLMSEALNAVCKFGFQRLNLKKITADVLEDNTASQNLLLKNGFKQMKNRQDYKSDLDNEKGILTFAIYKKDISAEP